MESCDLLRACVDGVVYKLSHLLPDEVVNTLQNERQMKRRETPDVVFTSVFKSPSNYNKTWLTVTEPTKPSLSTTVPDTVDFSQLETAVTNKPSFKICEAAASLREDSKGWPLPIDRCVFRQHQVLLFLDRTKAFCTLVPHILRLGPQYGRHSARQQEIVLTCEDLPQAEDDLSLRQLRVRYLHTLLSNLLRASGHVVTTAGAVSPGGPTHIHLAAGSSMQQSSGGGTVFLPGNVSCRPAGGHCELSAGDYLRRRREDMRQLADVRCPDEVGRPVADDDELASRLADAVTRLEMLQVKPSSQVWVDLCEPRDNPQLRAALFVLYNYTRMSTILRLFAARVEEGSYPALVPVQQVDFSLLTQQEEWCLLSRYLLMFPHLVDSCVGSAPAATLRPHRLCLYLAELSRVYSRYYRRVRVLTEPRAHLLPVMFARLHLLKAVQQVFHNALSLLDVTPLDHM